MINTLRKVKILELINQLLPLNYLAMFQGQILTVPVIAGIRIG